MEDSLLVRWPRECALLVPECLGIFWILDGLGGSLTFSWENNRNTKRNMLGAGCAGRRWKAFWWHFHSSPRSLSSFIVWVGRTCCSKYLCLVRWSSWLLPIATYCYCMSHDFPLSCWNHADPRCVLGLSLHRPNSLASNCPIHSCYFLLQQWRTLHQISWARGGTVLICITLLVDTATLLPGICRSSSQLSWAPPYIVLLCKAMSISSKLCGFVAFCSGALHSGGILTWISSTIFFYVYLYNIIEYNII